MLQDDLSFFAKAGTPPLVRIAPSVEVVVSMRIGDDSEACKELWAFLSSQVEPHARYVTDDRRGLGVPRLATDEDRRQVTTAIELACRRPDPERRIDWANRLFQDTGGADEVPGYGVSLSLGWVKSLQAARGLALRATFPPDADWSHLRRMGLSLATRWPQLFRWIGVGYRFVPVSVHSHLFEAAIEIVHNRSKRFQAVDVGDAFGFHGSVWQDQVRTPMWLMILSESLSTRVGGAERVRSLSEGQVGCEIVDGGILVQAGEQPITGDVNRRHDLSPYRRLDRILEPVRAVGGVLLLPPWDEETSASWLSRFK